MVDIISRQESTQVIVWLLLTTLIQVYSEKKRWGRRMRKCKLFGGKSLGKLKER